MELDQSFRFMHPNTEFRDAKGYSPFEKGGLRGIFPVEPLASCSRTTRLCDTRDIHAEETEIYCFSPKPGKS